MKGILLAGGLGKRLMPATIALSKQLIPIYDKPMIYYPLSILMLAGIRDIALISTPQDLPAYQNLFGSGEQLGLKFTYIEQKEPKGIAQAFLLAQDFIANEPCCLILGDNIFHGRELGALLPKPDIKMQGAQIYAYHVKDPQNYGVVQFDKNFKPLSLEEKPQNPKTRWAVTGLYFYDDKAVSYAKELKPSPRGELEITDLNRRYQREHTLKVQPLGRGIAWLDTGTHEGLTEASTFIQVLEKRQGLKIACLEAIAYKNKWIDKKTLLEAAVRMEKSDYGQYLAGVAREEEGYAIY